MQPQVCPLDSRLTETDREELGRGMKVTYTNRCSRCRHEGAIPDVVVEGFAASAVLKPVLMLRLVCLECRGPFQATR